MGVLIFKVRTDARNIYLYGNYGFQSVTEEYKEPIKKYSGETFSKEQIGNALAQGWITQEDYEQTLTYIPVVSA